MTNTPPPKALTHDQKKAADAAFSGRPFNEAWSASARAVYDGLMKALPHRDLAAPDHFTLESSVKAPAIESNLCKLLNLWVKSRSACKGGREREL